MTKNIHIEKEPRKFFLHFFVLKKTCFEFKNYKLIFFTTPVVNIYVLNPKKLSLR